MPEGIVPYPRWEGSLSPKSRVLVIVENEVRMALRSNWALLALGLGVAWGFASIVEFYQARQGGEAVHDFEGFLAMMRQLFWFSLGVAAALGGPSLLEDARSGALEIYLSRAVTRFEYLTGKIVALLGLSTAVVFIPALFYWAFSFVFYDSHPDGWGTAIFPALGLALMWGLLVSGLALGLSAVGRSAAGSALVLFGGLGTLEYIVDPPGVLQRVAPLTALTEDGRYAILSPFKAVEQQVGWLFNVDYPLDFPFAWGLAVWGALTLVGWILVAWRHPRARGEERVGA